MRISARLTGGVMVISTFSGIAGGGGILPAQEPPEAEAVVGAWQGTLNAPGMEVRLVFRIRREADGTLAGTMDSPDQGAMGLPLSSVQVDSSTVLFAFAAAAAEYTGVLAENGEAITGQWHQGGATLPLDLVRADEAALEPARPQQPEAPFPYSAADVSFANAEADLILAGTLTVPPGSGPHPAVVLISGSGPQDRDESILGHRPFLVLADHLSRRGIAVLRYDDRGVGASGGDFARAITPDFASDARAAVAFLASHPAIDGERLGLIGHSEGTLVAAMAADRSPDVSFVVLLAPSGVRGRELLIMQLLAANRALGTAESVTEARSTLQRRLLDVVADTPDDSAAAGEARRILAEAGLVGEAADAQVRFLVSPWMRFFLTYDPLPDLRALDVPVLALTGARDTQVPPDGNVGPVEEALRAGGNEDVTVEVLPGLNHLFQTAETGSPTEYARIEETFAPVALDAIADWISERVGQQ